MIHYAYLASPIDGVNDGLLTDGRGMVATQRKTATRALDENGFVVFDPSTAWHIGPGLPPDPRLMTINMLVIDRCDAVLALLPLGVPTIGTILEIEYAVRMRKPTIVVTDQAQINKSWALAGLEVALASNPAAGVEFLKRRLDRG